MRRHLLLVGVTRTFSTVLRYAWALPATAVGLLVAACALCAGASGYLLKDTDHKVRLATLRQHPSARWRPVTDNPAFVGVFRLAALAAS